MKKLGNAGHGQESYDPKTGKFIADGHQNKYFPNPDEEHKISEGIPAKKIESSSAATMKSPVGNLGDYAKPGASTGGEAGSASAGDVNDFSWMDDLPGDKPLTKEQAERYRQQRKEQDRQKFEERASVLSKEFGIDISENWDDLKWALEDGLGYELSDEGVFNNLDAMSVNDVRELLGLDKK